jgi:hypothetical protein
MSGKLIDLQHGHGTTCLNIEMASLFSVVRLIQSQRVVTAQATQEMDLCFILTNGRIYSNINSSDWKKLLHHGNH